MFCANTREKQQPQTHAHKNTLKTKTKQSVFQVLKVRLMLYAAYLSFTPKFWVYIDPIDI